MAGGLQTSRGGQGPTGHTNFTATMPTTSTTVPLVQPSNVITIANYSTSSVAMYVNFGGAATTSNFAIAGGASLTYDGHPLASFQIIAPTATTDTYGVFAH